MTQLIELFTSPSRPPPDVRYHNCGTDLWCITRAGEVCCADCKAPRPTDI